MFKSPVHTASCGNMAPLPSAKLVGKRSPSVSAKQPWNCSCKRNARQANSHHTARTVTLQRATAQGNSTNQLERREATAQPPRQDVAPPSSSFGNYLQWLVVQGVEGLQGDNAKLGLYTTVSGDRGMVCLAEHIQAGETVLRIPLSIAITDHMGDQESNKLIYKGAPWAVRLACKILREKAKGPNSPWHLYLQMLPRRIPSPLQCFADEDIAQAELPDMQQQLHRNRDLVQDAYQRLSAEARGGATPQEFAWAVSVVHSRTFGNASPTGAVGVHMLIPFVDLLNHGGEEMVMHDDLGRSALASNVRWDLKQEPAGGAAPNWHLEVSATCDIAAEEEILLSYGERDNDDFFTHYGFVPLRNPHDDVVLFQDMTHLLQWHQSNIGIKDTSVEQKQKLYEEAAAIGNAQAAQQTSDASSSSAEGPLEPLMQEQQQKLRVCNNGLVDERMAAALKHIGSRVTDDEDQARQYAMTAVIMRCCQLLLQMTPFAHDLKALANDCETEPDDQGYYNLLLKAVSSVQQSVSGPQKALQTAENPAYTQGAMTHAQRLALTYRAQKKFILFTYSQMMPGSLEDAYLLQQHKS